ncbi:MAG: TolC family protein [Helicobacteraceae bacterium]|nr:TolC family protein [Helicobacteraceae bacterium]
MHKTLLALLYSFGVLCADELREEMIYNYLSSENRHIQTILSYQERAKEQLADTKGSFDISSSLKYETKEYPQSSAEYKELSFSKRFESGIEFKGSFREAEGIQEYNNIKTGQDGEYLASLSAPLLPIFTGVNKQSYATKSAGYAYRAKQLTTQDALRLFTFDVLQSYYELLLLNQKVLLFEQLLKSAQQRESFVEEQIQKGKLAKIEQLVALRSSLQYQQKIESSKRERIASQHKLCYFLDISEQTLLQYEIPKLKEKPFVLTKNVADAIKMAKEKRDDLAALEVAKEGIALDQKLNQASRVSKSDLHLYSLYDPIYKEGYKVTFEIALSLEQTSYEAKRRENLIKHSQIALERELKEREIENELLRLYKQRESLQSELSQQRELVDLSNKLLDALKKRFELGSATLEDIVREEIRFLETQESLFHLQNDLIVNAKAIEMQMNTLVSKSYI